MVTRVPTRMIATTGVAAGTYSTANITVNEAGQIVSASSGVAGDTSVKITTIQITNSGGTVLDDTAVDVAGGYIKVNGSGFGSGCQVFINQTPATSTTFVSSTVVTAQVPAMPAGTYFVYLVNTDGATATKVTGLTYSTTPTWTTAAGSLGSYLKQESVSIQLTATGATNYVLASGSTLPGTLSLSSSGLITGTTPDVATNTTYSFTIQAIDTELQDSSRTFSITVQPIIKTFTISPAVSGKSTWNLGNDGPLNLTTAGSWTITPTTNFTSTVKVWGAAGGGVTNTAGGGGGYATGTVNFVSGNSYLLVVGSGGSYSSTSSGGAGGTGVGTGGTGGSGSGTNGAGGGGAGSGVFYPNTVSQANAILIGGGGAGTNGYTPGAGGGSSGENGVGGFGDTAGKGGTQIAAGSAGSERYTNEGNLGSAGSGMNGGSGGSGINGSAGAPRNGGGAGGSGYFGGGGGSGGGGASGSGGGASGRVSTNTSLVTSGTTTTGTGIIPGNSTDANRLSTAGLGVATASGGAGQIYIAI